MTNEKNDDRLYTEELILETQYQGPVAVISMKGTSLPAHTKELEALLKRLLKESIKYYVLNLSDMRLINSHQIGIIVKHIQKVVKNQGGFAFANPSDRVRYLLEITCAIDLAPIYDTVEEAVIHLTPSDSEV